MAAPFLNDTLKVAVAQMCQTIGFQGIFSTPADVLIDVLHRYLTEVCRVTHRYSEHFGRTEPNLDDLGLAFQDLGINVSDLEEYINNVDSPPFPTQVASVPVRRASNLNFLKPGSREILSRPIHIHEHLPPMYPEKEDEVDPKLENDVGTSNMEDGVLPIESPLTPSKRPLDADSTSPLKKTKLSLEEEGVPVREIVSVMMTTSGFISSSREGKLPEAAMPNIPMAVQRTKEPAINSPTSGKKKLEKIIRQKKSQEGSGSKGGSGGGGSKNSSSSSGKGGNSSGGGSKTPGSKSSKNKDGMSGGPHIPKSKPGSAPPKLALPPTLTPIGPPVAAAGTPQQMPPKLKMPPKIKVPKPSKTPKSEAKIPSLPLAAVIPKLKESSKDPEQKKIKKNKDKKDKDGKEKKDKEKKDKSGKEKKEGKKKDKENKKIKKEKDKEKQQEAERERELILKLASSAAVSITSIPPPPKTSHTDSPDKSEVKSKLSIFQKKIKKHKGGDVEGDLGQDPHMSRDSSPDLMIDENPGRGGGSTGQWKLMDDNAPSFHEAAGPIKRLDLPIDKPSSGAQAGATLHQLPDNMSPPGTPTAPRTPEIPQMPQMPQMPQIPQIPQMPHTTKSKNSEKSEKKEKKNKDKSNKEKKKKDKKQSKNNLLEFNSPSRHSTSESETPDRPKTPEAGVNQNDPSAAPFSLNPFPSAPGFIPPFSGFPLFGPFGAPAIRPPMPDSRLSSHSSFPPSHHSSKRPLEDDSVVDDTDSMERPLTPRHDREASPLPLQVVTSDHVRSPQSSGLLSPSGSIPRPRTPAALMSPQPLMKQKPDKAEKAEKKKEHKKEKKEKDKDKVKKKKDKKDKGKDKDEKKKDKEKLKLSKKEKKKGKKDKGDVGALSMKLTMKLPPVRSPPATPLIIQPQQQQQQQQQPQQLQQHHQPEPTPKLVIKPVVKHEEPPVLSVQPKISDNQPGSPEIAIAKFSALITRPPKASKQPKEVEVQSVPALKIKELSAAKGSPSSKKEAKEAKAAAKKEAKEVPTLKIKPLVQPPKMMSPKALSKGADEKKSPIKEKKIKEKKEKKEKKSKESKEGGSSSKVVEISTVTVTPIAPPEPPAPVAPRPTAPTPTPPPPAPTQKKPDHSHSSQQQQQQQQQQSSQQQQQQQSSQQQQSTGLLTETVGPIGHFVDDQGNEVWICPTCGKQDDGSPMIGCDTCDDWYHWVCVGIQVPPSEDINWYCPRCLSQHKQKGALSDKKKRGRKKK